MGWFPQHKGEEKRKHIWKHYLKMILQAVSAPCLGHLGTSPPTTHGRTRHSRHTQCRHTLLRGRRGAWRRGGRRGGRGWGGHGHGGTVGGKDEGEIHGWNRWILFCPRGFWFVCFVFGPNFWGEVFCCWWKYRWSLKKGKHTGWTTKIKKWIPLASKTWICSLWPNHSG